MTVNIRSNGLTNLRSHRSFENLIKQVRKVHILFINYKLLLFILFIFSVLCIPTYIRFHIAFIYAFFVSLTFRSIFRTLCSNEINSKATINNVSYDFFYLFLFIFILMKIEYMMNVTRLYGMLIFTTTFAEYTIFPFFVLIPLPAVFKTYTFTT